MFLAYPFVKKKKDTFFQQNKKLNQGSVHSFKTEQFLLLFLLVSILKML